MEKAEFQSSFLDRWANDLLRVQPTTPTANAVTQTPAVSSNPQTTPTNVLPQPVATPSAAQTEQNQIRDYHGLQEFAEGQNFTVTSTTGGTHNVGSVHGSGCAVDVRTRDRTPEEVEEMITNAHDQGITVRDERTRPAGQAVWSGPHVHLQVPSENRQANGTCFDHPPTAQPTPAQAPAIRP